MNERFSSALGVLSETLQVPVARILLADSSQRSLWFNATSASGKAGDGESSCRQYVQSRMPSSVELFV